MTTILESMTDAYLLATGKPTLPASTSSKYGRLFGLAKKLHRDWQTEPNADWNSDYSKVSAGIVNATDTFDLSEDIVKASKRRNDQPYVVTTAGTKIYYKLVDVAELESYRYSRAVAVVGQTVKFSRAFTVDDQEYGGEIFLPAHVKFDEITSVDDDVLVDDPNWFAAAIAYYYVLPDSKFNYLSSDLGAQADNLMTAMKANQGGNESTASDEDVFPC